MVSRILRQALGFAAIGLSIGSAEPLPIESFFRDAEISRPVISPDGTRIVFLVRNPPKHKSIAVYDVRAKKGGIVFVPNDYNVDFAFWKGDRIVFGGDAGGNESYALRSIKADGSALRDLSESYDRYRYAAGPVGGNVFSSLPDDPEHILIAGLGTRRNASGDTQWAGDFGLYRLNVGSGTRLQVERWDEHATSYFVDDRSGKVFGRVMRAGRTHTVELKAPDGNYRKYLDYEGASAPFQFIGLLPGEKEAILEIRSEAEHDRGALYAFDRETFRRGPLLYEPSEGEIVDIKRVQNGKIVAITRETDKKTTECFDRAWAQAYASLRATFPGMDVAIVSSTRDAHVHVVLVSSDKDPGTYYLFDTVTPAMMPIGRINPVIDPKKMADREPFHFAARDGLEIHGYLTRPREQRDRPHALIVLPHGGPFTIRDSWEFDAEAQFLANRGYAVLQVNYRGSGGYGARFEAAGKRQWGRAMQNDLTDAVQWAVTGGITSADRVGIYGGSYGGYAVLAGLTTTPELYRCGANYVGVSDLVLLRHPNHPTSHEYDLWFAEWVGDSDAELKAVSPAEHVAAIRVPTFHAYGENDPRVDIGQWKVLERELKQHHKPYIFIREQDEGHGYEEEKSRIHFYTALEEFLLKNLPPNG